MSVAVQVNASGATASVATLKAGTPQAPVPGDEVQVVGQRKGSKTTRAVTSTGLLLAANVGRIKATIFNNGTARIYLKEDNTVSTSNGYPLDAGNELVDEDSSDAWYFSQASGTVDVRVVEYA